MNFADMAITYGANGIRCGCGKPAHSNLSPCDGPEAWRPDTLPQWLAQRFGKTSWGEMSPDDQSYWEHEAAAVRRAVGRGGFKQPETADACTCERFASHHAPTCHTITGRADKES